MLRFQAVMESGKEYSAASSQQTEIVPPAAYSTWQKVSRLPMNWEIGAMIIVLAAALVCAWPEVRGMAKTSLWQDELWSIAHFSSKGTFYTLTNYTANNHIFFNLVNSLTPGKPFEPARARLWSFLSVTLAFVIIILSQWSAGQIFEGSFQGFLFLANLSYLDLILQARGYGLVALAAVACTVLTWQYFRKPSLLALVGIPLAVWLGTWSVPTFVLFCAALFFVLLIYTRDWRWIASGTGSLLAIVLVYWPVRIELLHSHSTYAAQWGRAFADWSAIGDIFSVYLLFGSKSWLSFLVVSLVIVSFLLSRIETPMEKASLCLGLAILLTFTASLKMETPAERTIAFTVLPFGFITTTLLAKSLRFCSTYRLRLSITLGIAIIALVFALHLRTTFHFTPIEAWRETAHKIEDRFPKGTEIVAQFRPEWLKVYLSPDYPLTPHFDVAKFVAGKQIVVDSSFPIKDKTGKLAMKPFPLSALPRGYLMTTIPQRRGRMQKIYFSPSIQDYPAHSPKKKRR
jgi:hypothetical protein